LPLDYPWGEIVDRGQVQAVRNEYGVNDIWAGSVGWFIPRTGPSGRVGFTCTHQRFEQDEFRYDHGEFFEKGHMEAHWIPFLEKEIPFLPTQQAKVSDPKRNYPIGTYIVYLILAFLFWRFWLEASTSFLKLLNSIKTVLFSVI
jgi:serine/threonine-protein kinase